MRQLWSDGTATLDGAHYQVDGAICRPLPLQDGGIPLWIAGGGEKKTLRIAARHARYTNFDGTPDTFRHKSEVLAEHCRAIGTDFDAITRTANYNVIIGATEAEVEDKLAQIADLHGRYLPQAKVDASLNAYRNGPTVGTPEQVTEALAGLGKLGMSYAICYFHEAAHDTSSLELFEQQVIPELGNHAS
jgi:alkanesulfonate monooxygenase SsuD/methylene tetrahydromethanopterin reductase-like flavin-dependent oxidoreductase (luciferase family)